MSRHKNRGSCFCDRSSIPIARSNLESRPCAHLRSLYTTASFVSCSDQARGLCANANFRHTSRMYGSTSCKHEHHCQKEKKADKIDLTLAEKMLLSRKCENPSEFDENIVKKFEEYESSLTLLDTDADNYTKDELFSQVVGEHNGRVCLCGTGVSRSDVKAESISARVTSEATRIAHKEIQAFQERTNKKMDNILTFLKAKFPNEDLSELFGDDVPRGSNQDHAN